ncbi:GDSL-like Lipase/Acylhydrolase family protein [Zhouia amylolytica]|uniref:GDSL-like Lipase/Acylhydrolase family protein n=1 Tax=Zhouia amylolytica TaxID=376730 RepID=A0A1I6QNS2_9FLAO|nr:GDSL-type esterase/lipase family protein [Zhouia amylolytica]SFS54093.1 GDSL-like Lipase/Acylhydrolase family protein [Zhouia amylolytica]
MKHIICFGDSITRGENDRERGGWADRLKSFYMEQFLYEKDNEVCVFNMGIGGETTVGLSNRFRQELDARLLEEETNLVTLGYGANDIALVGDKHQVSIEEYTANLAQCIDYAHAKNARVFLLSIIPVITDLNTGKPRMLKDIILYNKLLQRLAKEKNVTYVDLHSLFEADTASYFTFDGVHPNAEGHSLIYEHLKSILV